MSGKLIVIEAGDGSGKETQANLLFNKLTEEGYNVKKITYPNYKSNSSALIKMYLNGEFGDDVNAVNPYVASSFYAVDRFAGYRTEWEEFYLDGGIIIADRYTTSNMVHQAVKIADEEEKNKFLNWLVEYEYKLFGLPKPDCVVFLDVHPDYASDLISNRNRGNDNKKDIHEVNNKYLFKCYNEYKTIAQKFGWESIKCVKYSQMRSREDIGNEVYLIVKKYLFIE